MGLCLSVLAVQAQTDYYVSPLGNDANPGTKDAPLKSLEAVKYLMRQQPSSGPVTILMGPGRYELSRTLELTAEDAMADRSITIKPAGSGEVIMAGSTTLPSDVWTDFVSPGATEKVNDSAKGNIKQINLRALGISDYGVMSEKGFSVPVMPTEMELFYNDERMTLARWPNEGKAQYGKVIDNGSVPRTRDYSRRPGVLEFDNERISNWVNAKDSWLHAAESGNGGGEHR